MIADHSQRYYIINFKAARRRDLSCSHHQKNILQLCVVIEVLANSLMVIIPQYIKVSNQQAVYLKIIKCCMSIVSQQNLK